MTDSVDQILKNSLLLDIETLGDNQVVKIGGICRNLVIEKKGTFKATEALLELDKIASEANFVLGHNLLGHDLPILQALVPQLQLLQKPVIDTLYLSPLAFPENPYHRLVKDYKLVRSSLNDPVADARLAGEIFVDQWQAFDSLPPSKREVLAFYRYCFEGSAVESLTGDGIAAVFSALKAEEINENLAFEIFQRQTAGKACETGVVMSANRHLLNPARRADLAYCLAWLQVAGNNSVIPPWVRHRFPDIVPLLRVLRDIPCGKPECQYCQEMHNPKAQLSKYFGFDDFRQQPKTSDGRSLQEAIILSGLSDKPLLAILPTGGGKSLCFQLPALVRHARRGVLTVVVSPLQALMKDQVDNLQRLTGATSAGALYGMLTPPERGDVLERVRLGDIGILYVSPEQLRNLSFRATILQREIGCWVFDEAHCLSKWGHDFRPDYLYASRFIREFAAEQRTPIPPIVCFTATAKRDVREEIIDHFQRELGQELSLFEGGVERDNLSFLAQMAEKAEKGERIHEILKAHFKTPANGAAVIFCATRAKAEFYEEFLFKKEWTVAAFHAGLEAPAKREIQEKFIGGDLQVICATNAFGMGIDKDNVRLVIHADIPGSLENYLQEAGRAGRDRLPAECILLYSEQDIETQFRLGALSELSRHDISQILRGIRKARQNKNHEIVLTTGDLIRDDSVEISFDKEDSLADTKIKTAVSWLERAGFVERNHNRTSVYQGLPLVKDLIEARAKMARLNLSQKQRERWLDVLTALFNAKVNEGMSADELAELPSFKPTAAEVEAGIEASQLVLRALHDMTEAGLLKQGLQLTAYVRYKVADSSRARFEKLCSLEESMLKILQEEDPDPEGWVSLTLRKLNQRLIDEGHSCIPAMLKNLLKSLARDGKGLAGKRGSIEMRSVGVDHVRVKLQRDWLSLIETASRRREVARTALEAIHGKIPDNAPASKDSLVAFSVDDIAEAIRSDFFLAGKLTDVLAAIDRALMFLHEQEVIQLQQGLGIFRQAMTIKVVEQDKRRGYQKKDYEPLALHYKERVFQVHVMNEYALLALKNVQQALNFVLAYFTLDRQTFLRRYFASRKEELERATSAESYRQIVESLGNQVQAGIVAAPPDENILILAGPGSGKTRTVVHRCAYLLRVERVPARSILVLCFNRNASIELRRRLVGLAGDDAKGVIVQTYHGLAMRLCGLSFSEAVRRQKIDENIFDQLIVKATRLLKGELDLPGLASDEIRDRLLEGFRFILVDEYQDIDEAQYNLISALAGRTQTEADSKLAIMAVGDDDQNIYASFRHTNIKFIKQFEDDYQAQKYHLIENYRSTAHIIAAANCLIAHNIERMKVAHPIVINYGRRSLPPGGTWEHLDRIAKGKVQLCSVPNAGMQAVAVLAEIQRLKQCNPALEWDKVAVLARNHDELEPIRTHLEAQKIPVCWTYDSKKLPPIFRVREILSFLEVLREQRQQLATADGLSKLLADTEVGNPWQALLRNLLGAWQLESNNAELPVDMALEFLCDSLMEYRRDPSRGHGIYLGTVHGAKGLEFSHGLILGGGWLSMRAGDRLEEERRVYYVAMTRAKETLCLFVRQDAAHPHASLLAGDFLSKRDIQELTPAGPELMARRYAILGMRDINLGYAGRKEANSNVHKCLAGLRQGDALELNMMGDRVILRDKHGTCAARLSETASEEWQERLPDVESARVLALIEWRKDDGEAEYARMCQVDKWEVPLVEVIYRARNANEG